MFETFLGILVLSQKCDHEGFRTVDIMLRCIMDVHARMPVGVALQVKHLPWRPGIISIAITTCTVPWRIFDFLNGFAVQNKGNYRAASSDGNVVLTALALPIRKLPFPADPSSARLRRAKRTKSDMRLTLVPEQGSLQWSVIFITY